VCVCVCVCVCGQRVILFVHSMSTQCPLLTSCSQQERGHTQMHVFHHTKTTAHDTWQQNHITNLHMRWYRHSRIMGVRRWFRQLAERSDLIKKWLECRDGTQITLGDDLSHTAGAVTGYCTSAPNSFFVWKSIFHWFELAFKPPRQLQWASWEEWLLASACKWPSF